MKYILLFAVIAVLVWGVTGLTAKETIVFTALGFGVSVVGAAFILMIILAFILVMVCASEEQGVLAKFVGTQLFTVAMWNLAFGVVPDGKTFSVLGLNIWQVGSYLLYGMTVLIAVYATAVAFTEKR